MLLSAVGVKGLIGMGQLECGKSLLDLGNRYCALHATHSDLGMKSPEILLEDIRSLSQVVASALGNSMSPKPSLADTWSYRV